MDRKGGVKLIFNGKGGTNSTACVCRDPSTKIRLLLLVSHPVVALFFTSFGYDKHGGVEMEASEQRWCYTNCVYFFFLPDSMHPVHQLGRDNRPILHMSVFL